MKYYSLKNIKKKKCRYNVIYGERSSGKTFAVINDAAEDFWKTGHQLGVIRRWKEDFRGKRGPQYMDNLVYDGEGRNRISEITGGKYDTIRYEGGRWYFAYYDNKLEKYVCHPEVFAYAFAITDMEHEKSSSYPKIETILFDEFLTRSSYLPDEFVLFMNCLSTIIRHRDTPIIYMCANSVNFYGCPYFKEMGLTHVKEQKAGSIDVYEYGNSGLKVAVEYTDNVEGGKPSDVYFAFDNPKLKMITSGVWELDIYPHIQTTIEKQSIKFSYFILFDDYLLQCDICVQNNATFTFIHPKTTEIKNPDKDIIFTTEANIQANYMPKLTRPTSLAGKKIYYYFLSNKVFYSSNDVGEIVAKYLQWCNTK